MLSCAWKTAVVIPAYQPSDELIRLLPKITGPGWLIIIVDDGSGPGYQAVWDSVRNYSYETEDEGILLLEHDVNRGKGAALKTALRYIDEFLPSVQCIVTADADGQHLPEDIEKVAEEAESHPGELVLGVRHFGKDVPWKSRIGNRLTAGFYQVVCQRSVSDTQTGLRAFSRSLLPFMLNTAGDRYEYEMNVLLNCSFEEVPMREVPIHTVYHDEKNSCSHFDSVRDSMRVCGSILKFAASSLAGFGTDFLLFLLLHRILPAGAAFLLAANVLARVFSAALNYTLNTKLVFHDHRPWQKTLPQYATLAAVILTLNSAVLMLYSEILGIPTTAAKLLTEVTLFVFSFLVQSRMIYREQGNSSKDELAAESVSPWRSGKELNEKTAALQNMRSPGSAGAEDCVLDAEFFELDEVRSCFLPRRHGSVSTGTLLHEKSGVPKHSDQSRESSGDMDVQNSGNSRHTGQKDHRSRRTENQSRRSLRRRVLPVVLDLVLAAGIVGGDYVYNYRIPQKLQPANAATAPAASMQAGILSGADLTSDSEDGSNPAGPSGAASTSGSGTPSAAPRLSTASGTVSTVPADFASHFTKQVVSTDTSYSSPDISIELTHRQYDTGTTDLTDSGKHMKYGTKIAYTLADIYVRDISCLQTAFADDTYGIGFSERLSSMSARMKSVLAVNGDSYSNDRHKDNGTIIRNGIVYRALPSVSETCVLYRDGTMKIFTPQTFDPQQVIADGAWQTWVFGPGLLDENGKTKTSFLTWDYIRQSHPRTAIGYYGPGHYCMLVVDGREPGYSRGMFLEEMSKLFESLGCQAAYNLDGGHCSFMTKDESVISKPYKPKKTITDGIFLCEPDGRRAV